MTDAFRLLAVWLTPALWLAMPALILARGSEGLWVGLALTVAPLIAVVAPGGAEPAQRDAGARFRRAVLLAVAGISIWANVGLAADVAAWQGAPRWQGIAVAVIAGWVFAAWRGGARWLGVLWLAGLIGMSATLFELAREAGAGPLAAWERVASQSAFRFHAASSWVTTGQALGGAGARVPMVFAEEHRVTAPSGGRLRGRSVDGGRVTEREWTLAPGQSVTLRAGDRLEEGTALPLRFEPGKRVPGAPASGPAWSAWPHTDGWPQLGLCLTLVVGGVGLLRMGTPRPMSRRGALVVGAGLVAAFALAQGWAIYGVLGAPDVFLGGVIMERLADLQTLSHGPPQWTAGLQTLLLSAGLASFAASSIALRERLATPAADAGGMRATFREQGRWAAVIGLAGLAALWHADPWRLIMLSLGVSAAALGPATLWRRADARAATAGGIVGLVLFAALTLVAALPGAAPAFAPAVAAAGRAAWPEALRKAALTYPALVSVPAGAAVVLLTRRRTRRHAPAAVRSVRS
jgi:hypothetical protein